MVEDVRVTEMPEGTARDTFKDNLIREFDAERAKPLAAARTGIKGLFDRVAANFVSLKETLKRKVGAVRSGHEPTALDQKAGTILDEETYAYRTKETLIITTETLRSYQANRDLIPLDETTTGGRFIRRLLDEINPDEITGDASVIIWDLVNKALINSFPDPDEGPLDANFFSDDDWEVLKRRNNVLAQAVRRALVRTATEMGIDTDYINMFENRLDRAHLETESGHELNALLVEFPDPADKELLFAIWEPTKYFDSYIGKMAKKIEENLRRTKPGFTPDDWHKAISREFAIRVQDLEGKLYQRVDDSAPDEFFEEEEQKGGIWSSLQILNAQLELRLASLGKMEQDIVYNKSTSKPSFLASHHIQFWTEKSIQYDRQIIPNVFDPDMAAKTRAGRPELHSDRALQEPDLFLEPFYRAEVSSFSAYILKVRNMAKDQRNLRRFQHNARALFNKPKPENGWFKQLANYTESFLSSTQADLLVRQPDSQEMFMAAALVDKFLQAQFAKYDWKHQSGMNALEEGSRLTTRDEKILEYIGLMAPHLLQGESTDWRARRALIMALGDSFSLSMRHIEHGSRAIPDFNFWEMRRGGASAYQSYDIKDHLPYMGLYPQMHFNIRYGLDSSWWGNLMFMPVEGKDLRSFGKSWDHRKSMDDMKRALNAWTEGLPMDEDDSVLRFANWVNPTRAGSIFTRKAWRLNSPYEPYLKPHATRTESFDVTQSWKNIENIGVELLLDYVERIGDTKFEDDFFTASGAATSRERLHEHLYRRYFDPTATPAQVSAHFTNLENQMNQKGPKGRSRENVYRAFLYESVTRAMKQRIPTVFLRYETNREVRGRQRAYKEIMLKLHMEPGSDHTIPADYDTRFEDAVNDLGAAEAMLRLEISAAMKKKIEAARETNPSIRLCDINLDPGRDYELTEADIRRYLGNMYHTHPDRDPRIDRAVRVYNATHRFVETTRDNVGKGKTTPYLENFANKFQEHKFPFSVAAEELDRSLLALRASGPRMYARAIDDIGNMEEKFGNHFYTYIEKLKQVAADGKKDFSGLIEILHSMKEQMERDVGQAVANRVVHHLAAITLTYFKKDTIPSRLPIPLRWLATGRKNSMAAEFGGTFRNIWEWEADEVNQWCNTLEALGILPKEPFDVGRERHYEDAHIVDFKIPGTGKQVKFWKYKKPIKEFWYGGDLREQFGGTRWHVLAELISKYLPLVAAFIIYKYIKDALEENQES